MVYARNCKVLWDYSQNVLRRTNPPHFHVEYQSRKAVFDFQGNILKGNLKSKTATKLVREWVDIHVSELEEAWRLAQEGKQIKKIEPLD